MKKQKTNRQVLNQAIKELDDMDIVILRERILAVCEQVMENKEEVTESMKDGFMSPKLFIGACERIFKKVDFKQ
jgi:F420-0:gamma-glutamyl ligase